MWVDLLGHRGYMYSTLINIASLVKWLCQFFYILANTWYHQSFNFSHSDGCVMVSHCFHVFTLIRVLSSYTYFMYLLAFLYAHWPFGPLDVLLKESVQSWSSYPGMSHAYLSVHLCVDHIFVLLPEIQLLNSTFIYLAGSLMSLTRWPSRSTSQTEISISPSALNPFSFLFRSGPSSSFSLPLSTISHISKSLQDLFPFLTPDPLFWDLFFRSHLTCHILWVRCFRYSTYVPFHRVTYHAVL